MFKTSRLVLLGVFGALVFLPVYEIGAAIQKTAKKPAIQKGTTVRTKTDASGLYNQECYDAYYGCMDQFCISDNEAGGSCSCSNLNAAFEEELAEIQDMLDQAERISTEEVEKAKLGAQADIVFTGTREYDKDGNLKKIDQIGKDSRSSLLSLWDTFFGEENEEDEENLWDGGGSDLTDMTGVALYNYAENICLEQMPDSCEGDVRLLKSMYSRQISSDCVGYKNSIASKRAEAERALANANAAVRDALKESLNSSNKYDLGQCMVQFKKCMQTEDACGKNWENCVATIAIENMQNNKAKSTAGTSVATVNTYDITASTMEILNNKRTICENVLGQCVAVRNMVWPAFLREAAPTIKVAEDAAESRFRQSCLSNISSCIQKACKDDIVGKGVGTMDACLSRPDMARSFCKVEIDPCERMEPLIWGYVVDKLAAMRVDACTQEVKDCFTADTRCGENFQNCIGMDYDYIHGICPIDSLVVCKANNPQFSMDDLDSMLMGLYLNIDNAALDQCQELVDRKMAEVCGSTTDCNKFAADDTIGAGSIRSQKDGTVYRVTGMISFGSIKMGDASGRTVDVGEDGTVRLGPGEIGVAEYIAQVRKRNAGEKNSAGIIDSIEEELNNIAGTINRTIEMIEQDPEIQFCINGRSLSQITGDEKQKTTARFPNLLNSVKQQIAVAALRQAQNNYNAKFNKAVFDATKDASADLAQYMCQRLAATNGELANVTSAKNSTPLAPPYAISYEVGTGLTDSDLLVGGHSSYEGLVSEGALEKKSGSKKYKFERVGYTREVWSAFNRETRMCHFCTSTVTQSCDIEKVYVRRQNLDCKTSAPVEKCEDIPM